MITLKISIIVTILDTFKSNRHIGAFHIMQSTEEIGFSLNEKTNCRPIYKIVNLCERFRKISLTIRDCPS